VYQYALTKDQYDYWTELKKNSEQLGTLFDAQPSQLNSNIHSMEIHRLVLGYPPQFKKEDFVGINKMDNMNYLPYYIACRELNDVTSGFRNIYQRA
jgi:hypothetical protein